MKRRFWNCDFLSVDLWCRLIAVFCFSYAAYIAVRYAEQPLLDQYFFRQTQTALTSFWMMKEGFKLAYDTPVAGTPWSIPFEFPIYQVIVALVSKATAWPLTAVGRLFSFLFLACCLIPARSIVRLLRLDTANYSVFAALLLSSPLYLYWGRSFMIETASLFFAVAAIRYFIELLQGTRSVWSGAMFLAFMSLCILQKATTGLPVLAVLGLVFLYSGCAELALNSRVSGFARKKFILEKAVFAAIYIGVPLALGVAWTVYTDRIKALNPLGVHLTSSALGAWNWGSLSQRGSSALYTDVFWSRIFVGNLSGLLGLALFVLFFIFVRKPLERAVVAISLLMGVLPPLLFTNLHIVHSYYQTSNLLFAIFALAVCVVAVGKKIQRWGGPVLVLTLLMICSNYFWFSTTYLNIVKANFSPSSTRELAVAEVLKREVPPSKGFVAFGADWNSAMAFLSERKSFTVPGFVKDYEDNSRNPLNYMDVDDLGAVVLCSAISRPTVESLLNWTEHQRRWKIGQTHGCYLAVPELISLSGPLSDNTVHQCEGELDQVILNSALGSKTLSVAGWLREAKHDETGNAYVSLEKPGGVPRYFEALRVWRPDVNTALKDPADAYHGLSRIIDAQELRGEYRVGIVRKQGARIERCQFEKNVYVP